MKNSLIMCLTLSLFSCVSQNLANWPESIPQQQHFVQAYGADAANQQRQSQQEYLEWIMSFYQGNLVYQTGWLDVETTVLATMQADGHNLQDQQLRDLGAAIGAEWAKDNKIRVIDSRMLSLWGSVLQLAADSEQRRMSIELISADVEAVLAGNLSNAEIQEPRYEQMLQIELFGGF
jgi:hypothetical protein